jgi:hypothetical protein
MSTIRNPVGPLPPQIYWRRRIVVGLGVLAVLIIIVLIIVRPGTGAPAEQPLTLLNTGTTACTLQAGSDVQSYVITSGSDRIWASTDCQEPGVPAEVTLEPGEPLSSSPFAWSRTRSSADDCTSERDPVIAGGATYRLSVSVGEFESDGDRPFILN